MQKKSLENLDDENIPLTKTKSEKPNLKKIRSEKQIEAFNRTMEIRKQKVEQRKQEKLLESAKLLLLDKTTLKKEIPSKKITPIEKYTDSYEDDSTVETSSGEDTEEEIIMVKNKPKSKPLKEKHKKKPSRKTIIFDSSSESSSDSSGGSSEEYIKAPKRVSQRVKRKEVIDQPPIKQISRPEDFRVYFV